MTGDIELHKKLDYETNTKHTLNIEIQVRAMSSRESYPPLFMYFRMKDNHLLVRQSQLQSMSPMMKNQLASLARNSIILLSLKALTLQW